MIFDPLGLLLLAMLSGPQIALGAFIYRNIPLRPIDKSVEDIAFLGLLLMVEIVGVILAKI